MSIEVLRYCSSSQIYKEIGALTFQWDMGKFVSQDYNFIIYKIWSIIKKKEENENRNIPLTAEALDNK